MLVKSISSLVVGSRRSLATLKIIKPIGPDKLCDIEAFTPDKIRNFGIVAHVDHGKSSLADKILQMTNVISSTERQQFLDKLQVEQERGITVKAQTCSMVYKSHLLNLIDTPGHADFSFEVARSLAACDAIVLLVAANQGVQAQTIANFWLAFDMEIAMIPVINKIDLKEAKVEKVEQQLHSLFDFQKDEIIQISAKSGLNVINVLDAIVEKTHPPKAKLEAPFRALIFDSWYEHFRGAIAMIAVKDGTISKGQKLMTYSSQKEYEVSEVGIMYPNLCPTTRLSAGQIGYVICNMKTVKEACVGDTIFDSTILDTVKPFKGFKQVKPTVYAGLFPVETSSYDDLKQALERLCLNDSSVTVTPDLSPALGMGWKIGFLGVLHMEVFSQRLDQEYGASVILTAPNVEFIAVIKDNDTIRKKRYNGQGEIRFSDPSKFPDVSDVEQFLEPVVQVTIVVPVEYMNTVSSLCAECRGERGDISMIDNDRVLIKSRIPLAEVAIDFFERLKRATSGYASFDYEPDGHQPAGLVKLCISINGKTIDEFSTITTTSQVIQRAKMLVAKLKQEIPRQQYDVNIRATTGNSTKAIVQGNIKAYKKDFSQLLKGNFGGGGMERLSKKLSHQKKGKERLKTIGQIQIPKEAFLNVLRQ